MFGCSAGSMLLRLPTTCQPPSGRLLWSEHARYGIFVELRPFKTQLVVKKGSACGLCIVADVAFHLFNVVANLTPATIHRCDAKGMVPSDCMLWVCLPCSVAALPVDSCLQAFAPGFPLYLGMAFNSDKVIGLVFVQSMPLRPLDRACVVSMGVVVSTGVLMHAMHEHQMGLWSCGAIIDHHGRHKTTHSAILEKFICLTSSGLLQLSISVTNQNARLRSQEDE